MNNQIDNNQASLQTREWSGRLGTLAAAHAASTTAIPPQLSAVLNRLQHLHRTRQEVSHNNKAHEFIMGD